MTKGEFAAALAESAIASICQPDRCTALIRALENLARGEPFSAEFPPPVYERAPLKAKPERHVMFREFVCDWGCDDP